MKKLSVFMVLCSMLLISNVGYASNVEQPQKTEFCIVGAGMIGMAQTIFAQAEMENVLIVVEAEAAENANFVSDPVYIFNLHNEFAELPVDVGKINPKTFYLARHNKHLYNSRIKTFSSKMYQSDLYRSQSKFTC